MRRKLLLNLVLLAFVVAFAYFVWSYALKVPEVRGLPKAAVESNLGKPIERLKISGIDDVPRSCGTINAAYGAVYRRRVGTVVVVYFDDRDKAVCVTRAFSLVAH